MSYEVANCFYCGVELTSEGPAMYTQDHRTPRSKGGSNRRSNLVECCRTCNCSKNNRTLEQYRNLISSRHPRSKLMAALTCFIEANDTSEGDLEAAKNLVLHLSKPHVQVFFGEIPVHGFRTDEAPSVHRQDQGDNAEVGLIYRAYPRRAEPIAAAASIRKAVEHLCSGRDLPPMTKPEAWVFLHDKALKFARSPAGNQGDFTPHPAAWFNAGRYLEDESEWYST